MKKLLIPHEQINTQTLVQLLESAFIKIDRVEENKLVHYSIDGMIMTMAHNPVDKNLILSRYVVFENKLSDTLISEISLEISEIYSVIYCAILDDNDGLVILHGIDTESGISRGNIIICAKRILMYYEAITEHLDTRYGIKVIDNKS